MVLKKRYSRNIKSNLSFYVSIIILTTVCIMVYLTMSCGFEGMNSYIKDFRKECFSEDAQFNVYKPLSDEDISYFEEKYDLSLEQQSYIDIENKDSDGNTDTIRLFRPSEKINKYRVTYGDDITNDDELLLCRSYMQENDLSNGDEYVFNGKSYKVTGSFDRPDYISIYKDISGSFSTPDSFAIAMLTADEYKKVLGTHAEDEMDYYSVRYNNESKSNIEDFRKELNERAMVASYTSKENNNRISSADSMLTMTKDIRDVIVPIVFFLIMIIIAVVLERKIKSEQKFIGILSALGYNKFQLAAHYSVLGIIVSIAGSIIGVILSVPMQNILIPMCFIKLEPLPVKYGLEPMGVIISFVVPLILFTASVFFTAILSLRKKTISMITGVDDKDRKNKFRMEKSKLSLTTKYRLRSVFGKPVRTLLIVVGICFGSLIFLYTYGVVDSLKVFVNESVDQIGDMEYQYYFSELRTDEPEGGAKIVYSIFESGKDGKATALMGMKENDLMNYELVSGGKADIEGGGYYITKMGSVIYGVSKGDKLSIKNVATLEETTIKIDGIIDNNAQNAIYTSPENVYEITGLPEGSYNLLVSEEDMHYPGNQTSQVITKSSLRDQIDEVYKMMKQEIFVMVPFGVIICVFVIYIMINMLISESKASISMFKVLGYRNKEINRLMINIYHFVIPIAAVLGLVAGYIFVELYFQANAAAFNAYVAAKVSVVTCVKYFVLVFLSYIVSLVLLGRKVDKIEMTESLKDNRE